jgi:hypothetical protein
MLELSSGLWLQSDGGNSGMSAIEKNLEQPNTAGSKRLSSIMVARLRSLGSSRVLLSVEINDHAPKKARLPTSAG